MLRARRRSSTYDSEDVAEGRECDEYRQGTFGRGTVDVPEQQSGYEGAGGCDLLLSGCGCGETVSASIIWKAFMRNVPK